MTTTSGVVEAVARTGKSIKVGGTWYSAFTAASLNGAKVGDNVKFTYTVTDKAGTTYHNIKGSVEIVAAPTTSSSAFSAPATAPSGYSRAGRSFPVGPLDPERSIIRQNALTQANKLMETLADINSDVFDDTLDPEKAAELVITVARKFEEYAAGDLDAAIAAEAVEKMRLSMTAS